MASQHIDELLSDIHNLKLDNPDALKIIIGILASDFTYLQLHTLLTNLRDITRIATAQIKSKAKEEKLR